MHPTVIVLCLSMATRVSWNCETENEKIKSLVIQKKKERLGCSSVLLLNTRGKWWPAPSTKAIRAAAAKTVSHFVCSFLPCTRSAPQKEWIPFQPSTRFSIYWCPWPFKNKENVCTTAYVHKCTCKNPLLLFLNLSALLFANQLVSLALCDLYN